ncbi:serine hydrolase domain-containing protein [Ornithinimicrobium panacihumi]|uniref:serine hydrolase domain-containing protein n=1 Tax=Ornithinimicrobium panacihumi TaxID=2008449 RepID=UPI003F8A9204
MHRTTRSTRAATAVAAVASLALVAPAAVAAPERPDGPAVPDQQARSLEVSRAAEQATAEQAKIKVKGTPPGRSTPATDALDAGMEKVVTDGAVGVTVRVESPGLDWRGSAGLRDVDGKPPAGWQDRFRVASNTKTMIATLVLQEVERGTWTLDTPVEDVIPGLFPDHPDVTIRQLLSHTSGAPNGTAELLMTRIEDPSSLEQMLAALGQDYADQEHVDAINAGQWGEPGQFFYSNAGYVALGMLLEEVNGQDVGALLQQRVFGPAGMRHSSYPDEPGLKGPALREDAWVGEGWEDGWLELDGFDPDVFSHAGAAVSTTADLAAFNEALLTGELVDPGLLAEMMTPAAEGPMLYGLGLYAVPDPCSSDPASPGLLWGHDGASYGTFSVSLGSADGQRQVTLGVTGRDLASELVGEQPRWNIGDVLVPALQASCS